MSDPQTAWVNLEEPFCLCVGAGVTASIVGSWTGLLEKLTKMRYLTRWNKEVGNNQLAELLNQKPNVPLYPSTDVLEQGEYLLLDGNDHCCYIEGPYETRWREQFFMEQVHVLINRSIEAYISSNCDGCNECTTCNQCVLREQGKAKELFPNADSFPCYYRYVMTLPNTAKEEKEQCKRKKALSTLDAVIRLCLQGDIRQLIVYNFDDIIERLLTSKCVQQMYATNSEVTVKVFSYGGVKKEFQKGVHYHFGMFPLSFCGDEEPQKCTISLYHVHGIVADDITPIPLVFSEHSYIEYRELAFNWSNQIIMDILTRFNLLTVGFSGTDSNFRTIVKSLKSANSSSMFGISGRNRAVILTLTHNKYTDLFKDEKGVSQIDTAIIAKLNEYYCDMVNVYYKGYFDIDVWWSEDFPRLAQNLLKRIPSIGPARN